MYVIYLIYNEILLPLIRLSLCLEVKLEKLLSEFRISKLFEAD
jgi:hypothetical protein